MKLMNKKGAEMGIQTIAVFIIILIVLGLVVYFSVTKFNLLSGEKGIGITEKSALAQLRGLDFGELTGEQKSTLSAGETEQKQLEQIQTYIDSKKYSSAISLADGVVKIGTTVAAVDKAKELKEKALSLKALEDERIAVSLEAEKENEEVLLSERGSLSGDNKALLDRLNNDYEAAKAKVRLKLWDSAINLFNKFILDYEKEVLKEGLSFAPETDLDLRNKFFESYKYLAISYRSSNKCGELDNLDTTINGGSYSLSEAQVTVPEGDGKHSLLGFVRSYAGLCWSQEPSILERKSEAIDRKSKVIFYFAQVRESGDVVLYSEGVRNLLKELILDLGEPSPKCSDRTREFNKQVCEKLSFVFSGKVYNFDEYSLTINEDDKKYTCMWDDGSGGAWNGAFNLEDCCLGTTLC